MKKFIHVNGQRIRSNLRRGADEPVMVVKFGRAARYGRSVSIDGPSRVVYRPDRPIPGGARVWVETTAPVTVDGRTIV